MSASPSSMEGVTSSSAPAPGTLRRRPQAVNPLIQKKKKPGLSKPLQHRPQPQAQAPQTAPITRPGAPLTTGATFRQANGMTSGPSGPGPTYKEFPLSITKRDLAQNMRYHVMRFQSRDHVKIEDQEEFPRPLRLHRRDPRASLNSFEQDQPMDEVDDKEKERMEIIKAERKREREANQALIAPAVKQTARPNAFQKKTEQVFLANDTPEQIKRSQLRYEEALPWHLEDFEDKHTWTAGYEAELSEKHIALLEDQNGFKLVPLHKWYRFKEKSKF
ncbi:hypothetical protein LTS18_010976, partial [Coniosporium uncinatum]